MVTANSERLTMTCKEFAELAGISRNQAFRLAALDALGVKVIRFGRRVVLPRKAVLAMLSGQPEGVAGEH